MLPSFHSLRTRAPFAQIDTNMKLEMTLFMIKPGGSQSDTKQARHSSRPPSSCSPGLPVEKTTIQVYFKSGYCCRSVHFGWMPNRNDSFSCRGAQYCLIPGVDRLARPKKVEIRKENGAMLETCISCAYTVVLQLSILTFSSRSSVRSSFVLADLCHQFRPY